MAKTGQDQRTDSMLMYTGIFLMFAPVGVLIIMVQNAALGWIIALGSAAFSGGVSTMWAYIFTRRRWWLIAPLVIFSAVFPSLTFNYLYRSAYSDFTSQLPLLTRMIGLAVMCVVFTSIGFVLSVMHQRRNERRTARAMAELDLAIQVHQSLVPPINLATPLAEVHGRSIASTTMGGDLIDVVQDSSRLDVLLGDVSGHGVSAGVVMAMLKSCIRMRLLRAASLREIVADTNKVLADLISPNMFATFAAIRIRPDHTLEFALAGHLPIFHYRAAENRWDQHPNQNLPLGIDDSEDFISGHTAVAKGDILILLTDGLMEVQNSGGKELGLSALAEILNSSISDSLPKMHELIMTAVNGHGPQIDDQSLVLVKVA